MLHNVAENFPPVRVDLCLPTTPFADYYGFREEKKEHSFLLPHFPRIKIIQFRGCDLHLIKYVKVKGKGKGVPMPFFN
jgi:hypothetical protein